jgi:hypothetical protein
MWRVALGGFAVAHGLIHASFLSPQPRTEPGAPAWPFHLDRSWLLSRLGLTSRAVRVVGVGLVVAVLLGFTLTGASLLLGLAWWRTAAVASAAASLIQLALFFHPWLSLGLAINTAIIAALVLAGWPPVDLIGS